MFYFNGTDLYEKNNNNETGFLHESKLWFQLAHNIYLCNLEFPSAQSTVSLVSVSMHYG